MKRSASQNSLERLPDHVIERQKALDREDIEIPEKKLLPLIRNEWGRQQYSDRFYELGFHYANKRYPDRFTKKQAQQVLRLAQLRCYEARIGHVSHVPEVFLVEFTKALDWVENAREQFDRDGNTEQTICSLMFQVLSSLERGNPEASAVRAELVQLLMDDIYSSAPESLLTCINPGGFVHGKDQQLGILKKDTGRLLAQFPEGESLKKYMGQVKAAENDAVEADRYRLRKIREDYKCIKSDIAEAWYSNVESLLTPLVEVTEGRLGDDQAFSPEVLTLLTTGYGSRLSKGEEKKLYHGFCKLPESLRCQVSLRTVNALARVAFSKIYQSHARNSEEVAHTNAAIERVIDAIPRSYDIALDYPESFQSQVKNCHSLAVMFALLCRLGTKPKPIRQNLEAHWHQHFNSLILRRFVNADLEKRVQDFPEKLAKAVVQWADEYPNPQLENQYRLSDRDRSFLTDELKNLRALSEKLSTEEFLRRYHKLIDRAMEEGPELAAWLIMKENELIVRDLDNYASEQKINPKQTGMLPLTVITSILSELQLFWRLQCPEKGELTDWLNQFFPTVAEVSEGIYSMSKEDRNGCLKHYDKYRYRPVLQETVSRLKKGIGRQ